MKSKVSAFSDRTGFRMDEEIQLYKRQYNYSEWSDLLRKLLHNKIEADAPEEEMKRILYTYEFKDDAMFIKLWTMMEQRYEIAEREFAEASKRYSKVLMFIRSQQPRIINQAMGRLMLKEEQTTLPL